MLRPVEERREFQRLRLDPPIPASLGSAAVTMIEVGVLGARLHHVDPLDEKEAELRFVHGGADLSLRCELVRTIGSDGKYADGGFESGVRFIAAMGESGDRLRAMLGELVTREMQHRRAMPIESFGQPVDGDKTVRGIDAEYLCYRLENGAWTRKRIFLPEQPAVGFTVARSADSDEMQHLCRVYQASDAEGRRLIRLFAELSVSDALEIPPRG